MEHFLVVSTTSFLPQLEQNLAPATITVEHSEHFTVCTFWMIKALYRVGRKDEARALFEKTLTYGNHVGLFSEDLDVETKRLLGNFPQGYSHLALIDTAMTLSDVPDWFQQENGFAP